MDDAHRRLLERADRTFGSSRLSSVVARTRALIGVASLPAGEEEAQSALDKLRQGEVPTWREMAALEVMVRLMRPAVLSKYGKLEPLPTYNDYNTDWVAAWAGFRDAVSPHLYAIGRLDRADGSVVGTGFLISDEVLVTNRHVLHDLAFGAEAIDEGQAVVSFQQEYDDAVDEGPIPVVSVVAVHPRLDIALLRVRQESVRPRRPLVLAQDPVAPAAQVAVVGYPADDSARNPSFVSAVFQGIFEVKRGAPGEILGVDGDSISHDCSTLGGNSGSPVLALDTAAVVGVHSGGTFMYRNEAVLGVPVKAFIAQHL